MVWAGSQATKLLRAGIAVALAPVIDVTLDGLVARFPDIRTKRRAFGIILVGCVGFALALFGLVVTAWS